MAAKQGVKNRGAAGMALLGFPWLRGNVRHWDIRQAGCDINTHKPLGFIPIAQVALNEMLDVGGGGAVFGPCKLEDALAHLGRETDGDARGC